MPDRGQPTLVTGPRPTNGVVEGEGRRNGGGHASSIDEVEVSEGDTDIRDVLSRSDEAGVDAPGLRSDPASSASRSASLDAAKTSLSSSAAMDTIAVLIVRK